MKTFGANMLCDSDQVLMMPLTTSVTHEITGFFSRYYIKKLLMIACCGLKDSSYVLR